MTLPQKNGSRTRGGGTHLSTGRGGGRRGAAGGENLTLSQTARRTKNTPCHKYTLLKTVICIPCERERGGGGGAEFRDLER